MVEQVEKKTLCRIQEQTRDIEARVTMDTLEAIIGEIEDRVSDDLGSRAEKDMKTVVCQVVDSQVMTPIRRLDDL